VPGKEYAGGAGKWRGRSREAFAGPQDDGRTPGFVKRHELAIQGADGSVGYQASDGVVINARGPRDLTSGIDFWTVNTWHFRGPPVRHN
jgi:hypothetical protein